MSKCTPIARSVFRKCSRPTLTFMNSGVSATPMLHCCLRRLAGSWELTFKLMQMVLRRGQKASGHRRITCVMFGFTHFGSVEIPFARSSALTRRIHSKLAQAMSLRRRHPSTGASRNGIPENGRFRECCPMQRKSRGKTKTQTA